MGIRLFKSKQAKFLKTPLIKTMGGGVFFKLNLITPHKNIGAGHRDDFRISKLS